MMQKQSALFSTIYATLRQVICHDNPVLLTVLQQGYASAYPSEIAGLRVTRVVDFATGYDSGNPPSYKSSLSSSGHMIQFRAGARDDLRIALTIRYDDFLC
jgi:hypothetical protein